ncbi:hypothetical protein [Natrinema sp. H-ect4]|uniref:DUF7519 family protein n=1 Tax=Natrinema sp. H-ect4 TaxID=3242699 RepID=UPI0035A94A4B
MTGDAIIGSAGRDGRGGPDARDSNAVGSAGTATGPQSRRAIALETGRESLESGIRGLRRALRRPTASDVAMLCCTLIICIAVGATLVGLELAALAVGAGLAAAVTTALLASRRPLVRGIGGILAVPTAVLVSSPALLAGALALTSSSVGLIAGAAVWSLVVAAFAAGLVSWQRFGRGGVRRGSTGTTLAAIGVAAVAAVPIVPRADLRARAAAAVTDTVGQLWAALVTSPEPWTVVSFAGLVLVAAFLSSRALAAIPLERFVPPDRRDALATAVDAVRRSCSLSIRGAIALVIAAVGAPLAVDRLEGPTVTPADLRTELPAPVGDAVATLVTTGDLRAGLLALAGIAVALLVLERARRAAGRGPAVVIARLLAPIVGGALVALVLARALAGSALEAEIRTTLTTGLGGVAPPSVLEFLTSVPAFVLVAIVLILALGSLSSLLWTVTMLRVVRVLPRRGIAAALAAGSVFALAIGLAAVGRLEPAIWTAAAAFVLWDIGEYADAIRTELGRDAATMRAELVHVGGTVLSGGVVAGGTVALSRWGVTDVSITDPALAAVAVGTGLFAVVLVTWALRG